MQRLRQYTFIFILLAVTVLLGLNYYYQPFWKESTIVALNQPVAQPTPSPDTLFIADQSEERLLALLADMTPREKIAQLIAVPVLLPPMTASGESVVVGSPSATTVASPPAYSESVLEKYVGQLEPIAQQYAYKPGFFTLFGNQLEPEQVRKSAEALKNTYIHKGAFPLIAVDHEGGSVQRLNGAGFTKLAAWSDLCKLSDAELLSALQQTAGELSRAGIDVVLGPVVDVGTSKILQDRICSTHYPTTAAASLQFIQAFEEVGILPVIKHFPSIGATTKDLHLAFDTTKITENDLKLYTFLIENSERVAAMTAHVGVVGTLETLPCSLSQECVGQLKTNYPDLLIFSDALDMRAAAHNAETPSEPKELTSVAREAFIAGNDVLVFGLGVNNANISEIIALFEKEYLFDDAFKVRVEEAVLKILKYKRDDA